MSSDVVERQPERIRLWSDVALALLLAVVVTTITALAIDHWSADDRAIDLGALSLVAGSFVALALRRVRPILTLSVVTLLTTTYLLFSYPYGPVFLAFFIAVYTIASVVPVVQASIAVGIATLTMLTHIFVHPDALGGWLGLVPGAAWAVVPFSIGVSVRSIRQTQTSAREEALRRQLYDERMRVAQEVHDVVGHGLAAIQLQADVALHVDETQPPRTRKALESISRASKAAFEELATTLDGIQQPTRASSSPGIDDIERLCDRMRTGGIDIHLEVERASRERDEPAELTAYRVVQEALTNVARHGPIPSADVSVAVDSERISVRVDNPGHITTPVTEGRGLAGMRRRVNAAGGHFKAGPVADGFTVEAVIPHREEP